MFAHRDECTINTRMDSIVHLLHHWIESNRVETSRIYFSILKFHETKLYTRSILHIASSTHMQHHRFVMLLSSLHHNSHHIPSHIHPFIVSHLVFVFVFIFPLAKRCRAPNRAIKSIENEQKRNFKNKNYHFQLRRCSYSHTNERHNVEREWQTHKENERERETGRYIQSHTAAARVSVSVDPLCVVFGHRHRHKTIISAIIRQ